MQPKIDGLKQKVTSHLLLAIAAASCLPGCGDIRAQEQTPHDVTAFLASREACDHYLGEIPDPPNDSDMTRVEAAIETYCTGTDAALKRLKEKYGRSSEIMTRLNEFDPSIEAPRVSVSQTRRVQ